MKYIIYILFLTGNLFSQNNTISDTLILNDSLYNLSSASYSFQKIVGGFGYSVQPDGVQNINDFIKIENNQLKFRIIHGSGCGTVSARLAYNGIEYLEGTTPYYIVRLIFISNDPCQASRHKDLIFDISAISGHRVKFFGYNQLIN